MKSYYRQCKKCKKLKPCLACFLSKEENERLLEEDKKLCYECYILKGVKKMSNECNCGTCRHYNPDECYCMARGDKEIYPEDCCDGWEDEVELTDDEKREIVGNRKAHEIMEQEGRIE